MPSSSGIKSTSDDNHITTINLHLDNEVERKVDLTSIHEQLTPLSTSEKATFANNTNAFQKFTDFLKSVSQRVEKLGVVETTGIQRVPPYARGTKKQQLIQVTGFWISASGGLSSMSSFFLGPLLFGLSFKQSLLSGLVSCFVGCIVAAYCAMMGPQSGCRQMVTARYLFGWWLVKFVALVAIIGVLGWSVTNCVVGGEMLASISNEKIPLWVGVIIVSIVSIFVAIFGIKQVLKVEMYFSVPVMTVFTLLYICASDKYHLINDYQPPAGTSMKGAWLSFFSICYSVTSTWGSITADYYILFPEDTPKSQIFMLTLWGIMIPTTYVGVLALLLASSAMSYEPWLDEYNDFGMGGLLAAGFSRWGGFGKFCIVILLLSLISNNIVNTYSAAFGIQLSSVRMAKIPRWFWAIVVTAIYLVAALVGRNHFSTILSNFLPMIGYWISIYFAILLEENVIFRKHFLYLYTKEFPNLISTQSTSSPSSSTLSSVASMQNNNRQDKSFKFKKIRYNWDAWNDYSVLTRGYAAFVAFLFGAAAVAVSMSQTYWIGPIAKKLDEGDIAMWLSMGVSGLVYPLLRYWELKKFGR